MKEIPAAATQSELTAINHWLNQFDDCLLECDGMTSVLHAALSAQGFKVAIGLGRLYEGSRTIAHQWIIANDRYIIDLRARMWFPQCGAHGIFNIQDQPLTYELHGAIERSAIPSYLFHILAGFPAESVTSLELP